MSHATAPNPVLPFTCSLLSCSEQSFGAAPMDTAGLNHAEYIWTQSFSFSVSPSGCGGRSNAPVRYLALIDESLRSDPPLLTRTPAVHFHHFLVGDKIEARAPHVRAHLESLQPILLPFCTVTQLHRTPPAILGGTV